jgi:hypothetical protein
VIASVLNVPAARAAAIAAEYPLNAYPSPPVAFSTLVRLLQPIQLAVHASLLRRLLGPSSE